MTLELIKLESCPLCKSKSGRSLLFALEKFNVFRCSCGMKFIDPSLSPKSMVELYRSSESLSAVNPALEHYYEYDTLNPKSMTYGDYRRALQELSEAVAGRKLLEIGCGQGAFLKVARTQGWDVAGLDSAPGNIQALQREGIRGILSDFLDYAPAERYDAVVLWDLIEHPRDPALFVRKARELLNVGGMLLIATPHDPNLLSVVASFLHAVSRGVVRGPLRKLYFLEHTTYFSVSTLEKLISGEGFRKLSAWKTETDLARYRFSVLVRFLLRGAFVFARLFGLQNRVIFLAKKGRGK